MSKNMDALRSQMEAASKKTFDHKDSADYFQATNGAQLRFLPPAAEDAAPFVQIDNHAFKGAGGKWFIEPCPTTLNRPCPVCDSKGAPSWNPTHKARRYWVSNVWILKNPAHPVIAGKVMLFKYGTTILDKLAAASDVYGFDPFDVQGGGTFRIAVAHGAFPDYSRSAFLEPAPIKADEDALAILLSKRHSLQAIVDPSNFQSYEALKEKYSRIVGKVA